MAYHMYVTRREVLVQLGDDLNCGNLLTIPIADFDAEPVGTLDAVTRANLDGTLRYALDIVYRSLGCSSRRRTAGGSM